MKSARRGDTGLIYRNMLHLFTLMMKHHKEKKKSCLKSCQKNKIPRNKLNQGGERPMHGKLCSTDKGN